MFLIRLHSAISTRREEPHAEHVSSAGGRSAAYETDVAAPACDLKEASDVVPLFGVTPQILSVALPSFLA
jgi:hypothetical protein